MPADITISGEIGWEVTAQSVKEQFSAVDTNKDIEIDLSTIGGSVYQGLEMANMIRNHKGKTTLTVTAAALSMGSYIMQRADHVKVYDDSVYMMHNPSIFTAGNYIELQKDADYAKMLARMMTGAYSEKSGKTKAQITKMLDDTTWLYGQAIVDAGFANELIKSEAPQTEDEAIASAKLKFTECMSKLKEFEEKNKENKKIAALLTTNQPDPPVKPTQNGAKTMNEEQFLAFLATNPEAKASYDAILAQKSGPNLEALALADVLKLAPKAKAEHEQLIADTKKEFTAGKPDEAEARFFGKVMASGAYGAAVNELIVDYFLGKADARTVKMFVAQADMINEKLKSLETQNGEDNKKKTPAQQHEAQAAAKAKTLADAQALGKKLGTAKPEAK